MRRRSAGQIAAVLVAVALLGPVSLGCGGDDGSTAGADRAAPQAKTAWAKAASAACRRQARRLEERLAALERAGELPSGIGDGAETNLAQAATLMRTISDSQAEHASELRALPSPPGREADARTLVRALEKRAAVFRRGARAATLGDAAATKAAPREEFRISRGVADLSRRMGVECSE